MSKSRNTEIGDASKQIIGAYNLSGLYNDSFLAALLSTLETETTKLTTSVKRMKTESELKEKDAARFQKVRSVYYMLLGFLYHPSPEINESARVVKKVFDKYGMSMVKESYATKSALIMSMLTDFGDLKIQELIASLSGLGELIAALKQAQTDFEVCRVHYEGDKAKEGMLENATALKKVVVNIINEKLIVYLIAMQQVNEPVFGELARTVAQIIADNNKTVKKRAKKPKAESGVQQ